MEILGVEVLTRRRLYERIWRNTVRRTAAELGVKSSELSRACKMHLIPIPASGHWTLVHMNRVAPWQALPQPDLDQLIRFENGRAKSPSVRPDDAADDDGRQLRGRQAHQAREIENEILAHLARKRELKAEERERHLRQQEPERQLREERERQLRLEERARRQIARAIQDKLDLTAARDLRLRRVEKRQERALQMMHLCSSGMTTAEIAAALGVSVTYVRQKIGMAMREISHHSGLDWEILDHIFKPRSRLTGRPRERFSAEGVTIESVVSLSEWESVAQAVSWAVLESRGRHLEEKKR